MSSFLCVRVGEIVENTRKFFHKDVTASQFDTKVDTRFDTNFPLFSLFFITENVKSKKEKVPKPLRL